jgi:hypothetical protein
MIKPCVSFAASGGGVSRTSSTRASAGPRCNHSRNSSTAAALPCATTSTEPSGKLRALPRSRSLLASSRVLCRKNTPWTFPKTRKRRMTSFNWTRAQCGWGASGCCALALARAAAACRLASIAANRARVNSCACKCDSARAMAAWAAEKSAGAVLVAPAACAAAMACRASLISCTGAPAHPTRQARPTSTATKRNIGFADTSNSRRSRQTKGRHTMQQKLRWIRCAGAACAQKPGDFPEDYR